MSYGVYPEISNLPPSNATYYKWSNDNGVYTELAHPGLIELGGAFLVLFQGEQAALDNSKVGAPALPRLALGPGRITVGSANWLGAREGLCGEAIALARFTCTVSAGRKAIAPPPPPPPHVS